MSDELPFVTIVIPTRPGQAEIPAVTAARQLGYPAERLEILVARGRQPAVQRNAAIRAARGEVIYFLDDDARPRGDALERVRVHFVRPEVQMVGGPNVCPPGAPALERVFAVVLSSWLAFGPSRARYAPVGKVRETSEKELILCNLAARKGALLELGGFDESLYPNEENALMDDLQRRGARLIYDPELVVERRPRGTLAAFCRMLFTYGRGRAEQFRLHPTPGSALNFIPPLFVLYLVLLPWLNVAAGAGRLAFLGGAGGVWVMLNGPLMAYAAALLAQAAVSARDHGIARSVLAIPLVGAAHLFYGLGFWRGLFTRLRRDREEEGAAVVLDRIEVAPEAPRAGQ